MAYQNLKIAVILSQRRGYDIERSLGLWPGKLSKFIGGALEPTGEEKKALAQELGKTVSELFQQEQAHA
jgi:hypothetical protein